MCEQAEEIQRAWLPIIGDLCIHNHNIQWLLRFKKDIDRIDKNIDKWLPTQEQLQEMINWDSVIQKSQCNQMWKKNYREGVMLVELIDFYRMAINRQNDFNEVWLAFVMKEKYNKIWTGEKWVKHEDNN